MTGAPPESRPARGRAGVGGRRGAALLTALLVLLGTTLVAHAALSLASAALSESLAARDALRAELAARGAVGAAIRRVQAPGGSPPAAGEVVAWGGAVTGARHRARTVRVAPEWLRIEGEGVAGGEGSRRAGVALLWTMDPGTRTAAVRAVVRSPRLRAPPGAVDGSNPGGSASAACVALGMAPDTLVPPGGWGRAAGPDGAPANAVGVLGPDSLAARLGRDPSTIVLGAPGATARVTPEPAVVDGRCEPGPSNWGEPEGPPAACWDRTVSVHAPGDLEITGGRGRGLLVVSGTVAFGGGARFDGLVVAGGGIRLGEGAVVRGQLRSAGPVEVEGGSRVVGAACPVLAALSASPALSVPARVRGARWIPLF